MFVIQLRHYLEAAACGTSIQLALSATVYGGLIIFDGFQVLTTVELQTAWVVVKRFCSPCSAGLYVKQAQMSHTKTSIICSPHTGKLINETVDTTFKVTARVFV